MFNFLTKPQFYLRFGLGLMFAYSGYDIITNPRRWLWALEALPTWVGSLVAQIGNENFLVAQGVMELLLAAVFLLWFLPRPVVKGAALVAALWLCSIIFMVGVNGITFRDVGLAGAALALFVSY